MVLSGGFYGLCWVILSCLLVRVSLSNTFPNTFNQIHNAGSLHWENTMSKCTAYCNFYLICILMKRGILQHLSCYIIFCSVALIEFLCTQLKSLVILNPICSTQTLSTQLRALTGSQREMRPEKLNDPPWSLLSKQWTSINTLLENTGSEIILASEISFYGLGLALQKAPARCHS